MLGRCGVSEAVQAGHDGVSLRNELRETGLRRAAEKGVSTTSATALDFDRSTGGREVLGGRFNRMLLRLYHLAPVRDGTGNQPAQRLRACYASPHAVYRFGTPRSAR